MAHAPSTDLSRRHAAIRQQLLARGLDALVVTALPNILYLTNFTGSSAIVVVTADRLLFLTDFRYVTSVENGRGTGEECLGLELVTVQGSYDVQLADVLGSLALPRIGIEGAHLTVSRFDWLRRTLPASIELVATESIVESARVVKDDYEVATLREAARRLSKVARSVIGSARAGQSELELAFAIDQLIRQGGFEGSAFPTIVASGPNAALPHAHPGERKLAEGDLVVLDFGGVYHSYCVDLTRTVMVGTATERAKNVYEAVREAHDRAIETVAPGQSRFSIDAAARDVLGRHGLAEAFGHGTGHGLGIEVHEDPRITRKRTDIDTHDATVRAGMVFTIEPGAYLPGWGGVRIEDDVLVTESGVEVLTDVTTELIEI